MNERIVHKGNVTPGSFGVRIVESNGKDYYYHFLELEGGNSVIHSNNPFNLKGKFVIAWDELPFEVKEAHYKNIYPKDNLNDYDKRCFLYGKEQADEMIAAEKERKKQKEDLIYKVAYEDRLCSYTIAMTIYDEIGPWESFEVIHEKGLSRGKFCIDNRIITVEHFKIVSIEDTADYEAKRKEWGHRIRRIANEAGTSFEMATVVGKITDDTKAIEMLKEVVEKLNSDEFASHMKRSFYYSEYNTNDRSLKDGIRDFLFCELSPYASHYLNMSNKFCNEVKKILNNK